MRPKSSGHGRIPVPGPDSRFYVPPASIKALRWSIVLFLIGPAVLAFAVFEFALAHEWTGLVIALVMLFTYSLLKWLQIRAILRELARRRSGGSSVGSGEGDPTRPGVTMTLRKWRAGPSSDLYDSTHAERTLLPPSERIMPSPTASGCDSRSHKLG